MAVICLVGGRLFDHLYPSPPWAFHHLHLTNYSIRVKVGNAHAVAQATTSAPRHCSLLAVLLALTPPPSLLRSSPLCLTYAPLLLHSPSSVLPDLAWQCVMNGALLLSSAGLVSLPQPIVSHLLVPTLVCPYTPPTPLWDEVALHCMLFHILFPYKLWKK